MALENWENEIYEQAKNLRRQALEQQVASGLDPMGGLNLGRQKQIEEEAKANIDQMRQQLLLEKLQQQEERQQQQKKKKWWMQLAPIALNLITGGKYKWLSALGEVLK